LVKREPAVSFELGAVNSPGRSPTHARNLSLRSNATTNDSFYSAQGDRVGSEFSDSRGSMSSFASANEGDGMDSSTERERFNSLTYSEL
jgi:hypothetical protein